MLLAQPASLMPMDICGCCTTRRSTLSTWSTLGRRYLMSRQSCKRRCPARTALTAPDVALFTHRITLILNVTKLSSSCTGEALNYLRRVTLPARPVSPVRASGLGRRWRGVPVARGEIYKVYVQCGKMRPGCRCRCRDSVGCRVPGSGVRYFTVRVQLKTNALRGPGRRRGAFFPTVAPAPPGPPPRGGGTGSRRK